MRPCREMALRLTDFLAEELTADRQRRLRDHLAACPACGALVESYRVVVVLSRQLPALPLPERCRERLEAALRKDA